MLNKNKVFILGSIHSQHMHNENYSLQVLQSIIENVKPDVVLVELPVRHFDNLFSEFKTRGNISSTEIPNYPEYPLVILPYVIDKGIEIAPFSSWSKIIVENRDKKLENIKQNPIRKEEWEEFIQASELSEKMFQQENDSLDPAWIHTDRFDELMEIKLSVFNRLFNEELEEGGWDNINTAHYKNIEKELSRLSFKRKRILITIGAGHKGWLIRKLKERKDIELNSLLDVL